jgi:hypothetical protein
MRVPCRTLPTSVAMLLLAAVLPLFTACPKHENFPQPLDVQPVPTPQNFVITQPDPDVYDYDFTWTVDDPNGVVDRYRIYLAGDEFTADEFLAETQQTTFLATFPFSVEGLRFAVTAVSTENIEGAQNIKVAP